MSDELNKAVEETFFQKVKRWTGQGEERYVNRLHTKFRKDNEKQIALRQEKIDDAKERIGETTDKLKESLFKIDTNDIDKMDKTIEFIPTYRKNAIKILNERKELEKSIKTWEAEQALYQELNELVGSK